MKKTIVFIALMAGMVSATELTKIAGYSDLVNSGTVGSGVSNVSSDYAEGNTVYSFDGSSAITGISNSSISEALTTVGTTVTIAAWVNLSTSASQYHTIFGWGESGKGIKWTLKNAQQCTVTKNLTEWSGSGLGTLTKGDWQMVAVSLTKISDSQISIYMFDEEGEAHYSAVQIWNTPSTDQFAIGSQIADGVSEAFKGEIANLTVFTSTSVPGTAEVVNVMKNMNPTLAPEPATATLSLLALGALALRRRRA